MTDRSAPEYVVGHIQQALAEKAGLGELGLQVSVRDDKVFIAGDVPTEERRRAVADLVEELCPDYEIHNHVSLAEVVGPSQPEQMS